MSSSESPKVYLPSPGLEAVLDLMVNLGMPLLVTGEPGTGKTQLAYYVAEKFLGPGSKPLRFNTKTDSKARDLFYQYDAIRHFRDATLKKGDINLIQYISPQALGKAIIDSHKQRSVVLIDEIDKAPRDFPNDVLFEFENMAFNIKEASPEETKNGLGKEVTVDEQGFIRLKKDENRPILILTSNSEKNLPDAFMRRVLYHHIEFPSIDRLQEIVESNIKPDKRLEEKMLRYALEHFEDIRKNKRLRKAPATAELLAWIDVLHRKEIDLISGLESSDSKKLKEQIFNSYALIAKNKEDMLQLKKNLGLKS